MQVLFRLKRNSEFVRQPHFEQALLGYEWLEVMAIAPVALGKPDANWGEWCAYTVVNDYLCRTPDGLVSIRQNDVTAAIESQEMRLDVPH